MTQASRVKTIFVCSNCGNEFLAWQGQCSACGEWNSLREVKSEKSKVKSRQPGLVIQPVILKDVTIDEQARITTGFSEFDRVLGGGVVPGSIGLIGGDPGIGKSTLLLQIAHQTSKVLYISGEESAEQIAMRVKRLGLSGEIQFMPETNVDRVIQIIDDIKPNIAIIDSIQTMYDESFPSTPGSIVQVRETALRFQQIAKQSNIATILVGHVTKEGVVAGPSILEHMIDYLIYLEGDRQHDLRILRGVKNRFGSTDEVGVFKLTDKGFQSVNNPGELFISDHKRQPTIGSLVSVTVEGKRPFLVEIQALVAKTIFGYPKRTVSGPDLNRLNLIAVILQKRANIKLDDLDIYVSSVGGIMIREPAVDLAISLALVSAKLNQPMEGQMCAVGELDLVGRIRPVIRQKLRIDEAQRLGYDVVSSNNFQTITDVIQTIFSNH